MIDILWYALFALGGFIGLVAAFFVLMLACSLGANAAEWLLHKFGKEL